jgi:hypothetical protein
MTSIDAEIRGLRAILRKAGELIDDAAYVYKASRQPMRAARLKGIARQIDDELYDLDRRLADAERAAAR